VTAVSLTAGTRLGAYEVVAPLGAGGMGEVYRARDLKLHRDVAIKILPQLFALDVERLARFEREAQLLASLNHSNIGAIYGLEEAVPSTRSAGSGSTVSGVEPSTGSRQAVRALVLELVEGPTLADRIARGPIPLDEALPIGRQIADALEAAHEHGVVHRDLKPSNIKIRPDGTVKVLDFGLAKAMEAEPAAVAASMSPTIESPAATRVGMILGTAAYMSPEQARGKAVDKRSDIWAFGCVLYEMLTGLRAFGGEEVSDVLAKIIEGEADLRALPLATPPEIRRLLRRSLQKDRTRRLPDIADARIEIDEARSGPHIDGPVAPRAPRRRERLAWISALALAVLVAAVMGVRAFRPIPPVTETRLDITTPPTTAPTSLAISPDGQKVVFVTTSEGRSRLWLRSLNSVSARALAGTDLASYPFWSPDSRSVGFFADGRLKRIDIDGELVQALATAAAGRGGTWNRDDVILFAANATSPIFRISATGGEPIAVTRPEAQSTGHRFPQFLPDGRHFLYYFLGATPETRGVYISQLEGSETRRLLDADAPAVYDSSGHLLFVRQGTLFAQRFDPDRLTLTGTASSLDEQVMFDAGLNLAALSTSAAGPIVYRAGSAGGIRRQLIWFDRSGKNVGRVGDADSAGLGNPSHSPDGQRVALQRTVNGNQDLWLLEVARGVLTRFTFDAANDANPTWSPDGRRIVFASNRKGAYDLYQKPATGAGSEELLLTTPQNKVVADWSRDGRFLLYRSPDPKTSYDIWALPLDGARKPFPVVQTNFEERDGQFSPDGKWIAYQSNESGRFEIYVQPFPGPGGKWQISTNGGAQVRWRGDGKEVFYIALDDRLMAAPIRLAPDGQAVEAGTPVPLFTTRAGGAVQFPFTQQYLVSPDGQRFLMNTVTEEATSPITVLLNWKAEP